MSRIYSRVMCADGNELNCRTGNDQFEETYHADLIGAHSVAHTSTHASGADKSRWARHYRDSDSAGIYHTIREFAISIESI